MNSISLFVSAPCHLQQMTAVIHFVISEEVPVSVILRSPQRYLRCTTNGKLSAKCGGNVLEVWLDLTSKQKYCGGKPPLGARGGETGSQREGFSTWDQGIKTFWKGCSLLVWQASSKFSQNFCFDFIDESLKQLHVYHLQFVETSAFQCFSILFNNYACRQHFNGLKYNALLLFSQHLQLHLCFSNLSLFVAGRCLFHGMMLAWLALMHWSGAQHPHRRGLHFILKSTICPLTSSKRYTC